MVFFTKKYFVLGFNSNPSPNHKHKTNPSHNNDSNPDHNLEPKLFENLAILRL